MSGRGGGAPKVFGLWFYPSKPEALKEKEAQWSKEKIPISEAVGNFERSGICADAVLTNKISANIMLVRLLIR